MFRSVDITVPSNQQRQQRWEGQGKAALRLWERKKRKVPALLKAMSLLHPGDDVSSHPSGRKPEVPCGLKKPLQGWAVVPRKG